MRVLSRLDGEDMHKRVTIKLHSEIQSLAR